jgi:hypothetical protein
VTTGARLVELAPRIARLAGFLVAVAAGLALVAPLARRPAGAGDLAGLGAGVLELVAPAGRAPRPGPRVLELNGQRLHLETGTSADGVAGALDAAAAACHPVAPGERGAAPAPLRGGDDRGGFVACATWLSAAEAEAAVADRGDEAPGARVAGYRYVYAAASGAGTTTLVRLYTASPIDLPALFPRRGDAPGRDAPGLPRPPGARRLLSAREPGQPQELTLYEVARGQRAALDRFYRAALPAGGWRALGGTARAAAGDVLVVDRAGALAALVFAEEPDSGSVAILTSL